MSTMTGTWVALEGEALEDYLAGAMCPIEARETEHGVEVLDPHEWQYGRFTGAKTCSRCGLMPLDYDGIETECEDSRMTDDGMKTTCEYCDEELLLTTVDDDGVLIGDECRCGEYVTRYMPGQEPL